MVLMWRLMVRRLEGSSFPVYLSVCLSFLIIVSSLPLSMIPPNIASSSRFPCLPFHRPSSESISYQKDLRVDIGSHSVEFIIDTLPYTRSEDVCMSMA